jgi:hypothetical protein
MSLRHGREQPWRLYVENGPGCWGEHGLGLHFGKNIQADHYGARVRVRLRSRDDPGGSFTSLSLKPARPARTRREPPQHALLAY